MKNFDKKEWSKQHRELNIEKYKEKGRKYEQTDKRKEYMKSEKKKEYYKSRYVEKRDEIREKQRQYYLKNKTKINEKNKQNYLNNKETYVKNSVKYRKNRILTDPTYHLSVNIRSLINNSIKRKGYTKRSKTFKILGCSYEEFKLHLESKFEPWMNWENYGKYDGSLNYGWDIDHIIPNSISENEEDVIRLNHYTNLQPLCSKVNRDIKKNH